MADFAEKLGRALRHRGVSRAGAARELGVSPQTVGRWLKREAEPSLAEGARLADWLGVALDYLARDEVEDPLAAARLDPAEANLLNIARMLGVREAGLILARQVFGAGGDDAQGGPRPRQAAD